MSEIDDLTKAIANLAERVRRLETQEVALAAGAPLSHAMVGAQHTYVGGAALDVFGLSAANTIAKLTPSSAPGAVSAILKSTAAGALTLEDATLNNDLVVKAGILVGAAPTGGDQGAGTINTDSYYYHDGVVVSPPAMHTPLWLAGYEENGTDGFMSAYFNTAIETGCTIIQVVWTYFIETTNDANNYWTVTLRRDDTAAALITWDTSAETHSTKYRHVTAYNVAITTGMNGLYIQYDKDGATGAPGNIQMWPPIIQVKP